MKQAAVVTLFTLLLTACNASRSNPASTTAPEARSSVPPSVAASPAAPTPVAAPSGSSPDTHVRTFDEDPVGAAPAKFSFGRTGSGALGRWVVRAEPGAPSGANVLAQLDADDTDFRFPIAALDAPVLRDVRTSVRCKMISGRVDQACGLVARYRDENNYYITRANALENNIRLYTVQGGRRHQLASWAGQVTLNVWHDYRLDVKGDHIEVYWNGQRVLDAHDTTFGEPGRVGVWTKADSITYFDDLHAEAL
jgi:hypothetical protein